jgi:hypothetical protein
MSKYQVILDELQKLEKHQSHINKMISKYQSFFLGGLLFFSVGAIAAVQNMFFIMFSIIGVVMILYADFIVKETKKDIKVMSELSSNIKKLVKE